MCDCKGGCTRVLNVGGVGGPVDAADVSINTSVFPPWWSAAAPDVNQQEEFDLFLLQLIPAMAAAQAAYSTNIDFLAFGGSSGGGFTEAPAGNGLMIVDAISDGTAAPATVIYRIDAPSGITGSSILANDGRACTIIRTDQSPDICILDFGYNGSQLDNGILTTTLAPNERITFVSDSVQWHTVSRSTI